MTLKLPPELAILGACENLLLPPGMTEADRDYVAGHKPRILTRLRSTQMNAAGFYIQAPYTIVNEIRAAPWAAVDIQTTAFTRFSRPIRVIRNTAIGGVEWQAYRAAHPDAKLNSFPRARVLSVYTEALGHLVWDLDALKREERLMLFEAVIDRKIIVGFDLGFDFSWLLGETMARPSFVLDAMILFRQIRPAALLRPYRWAGFSDEGKQRFATSLLERYRHTSSSMQYLAACAEVPSPEVNLESAANWCASTLSGDHLACAKSNLDVSLQLLRFVLPGVSVEQMPRFLRDTRPWYVSFQTALVRLAEAHIRGVAFDTDAARSLMTDLFAEIESAASGLGSDDAFAGLEAQLRNPHVGETGDIKRALAAHAAENGVTFPPKDSGYFERRTLESPGSGRVQALHLFEQLRTAKKAFATVEEYRDAARHDARLHSVVCFTTITGRTSSNEPSLQNVPRDARFRRLFKARPGYVILAADYAAMELCIAAALADRAVTDLRKRISSPDDEWFLRHVRRGATYSGVLPYPEDLPDGVQPTPEWRGAAIAAVANAVWRQPTQVMASILQRGLDPHLVTAADFARRGGVLDFEGHPLRWVSTLDHLSREAVKEKLTRERQSAKAANFGLLYGMREQGLHASGISKFCLSWTLREASEARRAWFRLYPEFHLWHEWTKHCQSERSDREKWRIWGFGEDKSMLNTPKFEIRLYKTTTLTGRPIAALNELNAALNYQAQGTGADILASAIAALPEMTATMMMMPVHDELVFEVPSGSADAIRAEVEATMVAAAASVLGPSIPARVETSVGQTWSGE